jgi:hypothetical protein
MLYLKAAGVGVWLQAGLALCWGELLEFCRTHAVAGQWQRVCWQDAGPSSVWKMNHGMDAGAACVSVVSSDGNMLVGCALLLQHPRRAGTSCSIHCRQQPGATATT